MRDILAAKDARISLRWTNARRALHYAHDQ